MCLHIYIFFFIAFILRLFFTVNLYFVMNLVLQVWYAASYAEFVNQKVHDVTDEERKGKL